jgi:hypothetical protein
MRKQVVATSQFLRVTSVTGLGAKCSRGKNILHSNWPKNYVSKVLILITLMTFPVNLGK